jgi:hypothetical protein
MKGRPALVKYKNPSLLLTFAVLKTDLSGIKRELVTQRTPKNNYVSFFCPSFSVFYCWLTMLVIVRLFSWVFVLVSFPSLWQNTWEKQPKVRKVYFGGLGPWPLGSIVSGPWWGRTSRWGKRDGVKVFNLTAGRKQSDRKGPRTRWTLQSHPPTSPAS